MRGPSTMCQPSTQSTAERRAQRRKIRHLLNTVTPRVKRDLCFTFERLVIKQSSLSIYLSFARGFVCTFISLISHFCFFYFFIFLSLSVFHSSSLFFFLPLCLIFCYFLCLPHACVFLYFFLIMPLSFYINFPFVFPFLIHCSFISLFQLQPVKSELKIYRQNFTIPLCG